MDHMGSDLTVVNAARASFDKESTWLRSCWSCDHKEAQNVWTDDCCPKCGSDNSGGDPGDNLDLKPSDAGLIRYLASGYRTGEWDALLDEIIGLAQRYGRVEAKRMLTAVLRAYKAKAQHWAPFAHPHLQLRMSLPIFLARQFVKHQVGAVWSEESRRYVSDEPGVWFPKEWHTRPDDIKQGSGGLIEEMIPYQGAKPMAVGDVAEECAEHAVRTYMSMVREGVAPEEARTVLPLNMMTTVVWTGSLLFWSRVANQRVDNHAQLAAQELGRKISAIVEPRFPVSWAALVEGV